MARKDKITENEVSRIHELATKGRTIYLNDEVPFNVPPMDAEQIADFLRLDVDRVRHFMPGEAGTIPWQDRYGSSVIKAILEEFEEGNDVDTVAAAHPKTPREYIVSLARTYPRVRALKPLGYDANSLRETVKEEYGIPMHVTDTVLKNMPSKVGKGDLEPEDLIPEEVAESA